MRLAGHRQRLARRYQRGWSTVLAIVASLVLLVCAGPVGRLGPLGLQATDEHPFGSTVATSPVWNTITSSPSVPSGPGEAVFDPAAGYSLYFGNDGTTWTFKTGQWTNLTSVGGSPGARTYPALVYDGSDSRVLLFGGERLTATGYLCLNDTWEFVGAAWLNITSASPRSPPASTCGLQQFAQVAYDAHDAHDGYVLLLDDTDGSTWEFSHGGWSPMSTSGSPGSSYGAAMAYDPNLSGVLLFGGFPPGNSPSNWTWLFTGGNWSWLFPATSPPPVYGSGMVYYPPGGYVILAGGCSSLGCVGNAWEFNGTDWISVESMPTAGTVSTFTFDSVDGYAWLSFGFVASSLAWGPPFVPPHVTISATPSSGHSPLNIAFASSVAGGQPPYTFLWSDSNQSALGNTSGLNWTFTGPASTFEVTLTVKDVYGETGVGHTNVTLLPTPPGAAYWTAFDTELTIGLAVAALAAIFSVVLLRARARKGPPPG